MTCQDDQMCDRLKVGIDGAFNRDQYIWNVNSTTKDYGFLLLDANNVFNEIN